MQRALVIILILVAGTTQAAPKTKTKLPAKPDPIALAHERVKDMLKDPDSARFRSEFVTHDGTVCGFVNAKNSYGGYGGFKRYIVETDRVTLDDDSGDSWKMDSHWADVCPELEPASK
jgi:hypothetical protein